MIFELIQVHDAKRPGHYKLMRKVNFDPSKDKLFSEPLKAAKEEKPAANEPVEAKPKRATRKRTSKG